MSDMHFLLGVILLAALGLAHTLLDTYGKKEESEND